MSINSGDRPWPQTLAHKDLDWPTTDQRILVPFHEAVNLHETSLLGASIAFGTDGELYLLHAIDDEIDKTDVIRHDAEVKKVIKDQFSVPLSQAEEIRSPKLLESFIDTHSITTTVIDSAEQSFLSSGLAPHPVATECHSVVATRMDRFDAPASILVAVAAGPHSGLATRVAEAIAKAYDCWLELFHVIPDDAGDETKNDAEKLLEAYESRLDDAVDVDHLITSAPDPADAIIEHADYHDLTILGAPQKGTLRRFLFGSTPDTVKEDGVAGPVLTVHRNTTESIISRWL